MSLGTLALLCLISKGGERLPPKSAPARWLIGVDVADVQLRAQAPKDALGDLAIRARPDSGESCALRIEERAVQWFHLSAAGAVAIGPPAHVHRRRNAFAVDVVASGMSVAATLFDATTGSLLAKVSGECPLERGDLGFIKAGARTLRSLLHPACGKAAAVSAPALDEAVFTAAVTADTKLPREALVVSADESRVTVRLTARQLAAAGCQGIELDAITADLPWRIEDRDYLLAEQAFARDGEPPSRGYVDGEMVEARLRALRAAHPRHTRLEQIGTSHEGRPLWALAVATELQAGDPRPTLLLNGAHHGDELVSITVVLDAAERLLAGSPRSDLGRIRAALVTWCVPVVNPDGLSFFLRQSVRGGRKNGRDADGDGVRGVHDGVNLNRNYPFGWRATASRGPAGEVPLSRDYPGPSAASEPETRGMIALAERERFVGAVSYHMGTVAILAPYTVSGVGNPEPNEAMLVADHVTRRLPRHPEERAFVLRPRLYEVDGTDQDWHRHAHGTVALLAEIGSWPPPLGIAEQQALIEAGRRVWIELAQRFVRGPALVGTVRRADGTPLAAEVRVEGQKLAAEERWSSRRRDGHFARYIVAPGRYRLHVDAGDVGKATRDVTVGNQPALLEVVLP